ncbi:hypothetical protein [Streptomyces sp. MST-110588]|uniref:hypothetical protein n=1 Tax=Streptomyces sp. MST-110588 TaxID=2833628 RepID=UPI001F5CDFFD|nr:hypothetical protein [Streptomyces sp. MST-110588]UNO43565.1 hypothetical protein KGS77_33920 [Streptomyces sp. MST-110588]
MGVSGTAAAFLAVLSLPVILIHHTTAEPATAAALTAALFAARGVSCRYLRIRWS